MSAQSGDELTVDFSALGGPPTYQASGFIYGLSPDAGTPSQDLLTDIKVRFLRAGGSQIGAPNGGWINGRYEDRLSVVRAYHAKAMAVGASFILLLPGLWGADGVCNVARYPGDDDEWSEFSSFLSTVIDDAIAYGLTGPSVQWEIWNEPDLEVFWPRGQRQYLELWGRAFKQIRAAFPDAVITGPSLSRHPHEGNDWWTSYLEYVRANAVAPDILSLHEEEGKGGDPVDDRRLVDAMLAARGITVGRRNVNEYGAAAAEQQPGPSAWYIARLERADMDGLRGNWGMVGQSLSLYATMGGLVTADNRPMGPWWVYKRYADQTGLRVGVTPGSRVDAVACADEAKGQARVLVGNEAGATAGAVAVHLKNLPAYLRADGAVRVEVERIPASGEEVSVPAVVSQAVAPAPSGSVVVTLNWANPLDAFAITLLRSSAR
jgi:hypothetical protein